MRRIALLAVLLAISSCQSPHPPPAQEAPAPETAPMSDEDQIRARTEEYAQAFSRGDAKAVTAIFTDDGDFVGPDGVMHHGKAAVEERFRRVFDGAYKGAQATIEVGAVRLLRPEIAIVDGTYELNGLKSADGQPIGAVSGLYTNVWVKRDGKWSLHCLRSMVPVT